METQAQSGHGDGDEPLTYRKGALMSWNDALGGWETWMRAANRPETTIGLRKYQLGRFAADHERPWPQSTKTLIEWISSQGWGAESMRSYRAALRSFYSWCYAMGISDHDPAALLPPIRPKHHLARPTPEAVLAQALLAAEPRVRLMVLLGARMGLRRGEIARIHSDDVVEASPDWLLLVHGKGSKERIVPITDRSIGVVLRLLGPGWAFPGPQGHLSAPYVGKLMSSVLGVGWTAHTLRHRFATVVYAGSQDLLAVQELLGHSKTDTTRQYVKLPGDALRNAMRFAA